MRLNHLTAPRTSAPILRVFVITAVCCWLAACGEAFEPVDEATLTGHERMLSLLAEIEQDVRENHRFLSDRETSARRARIEALPPEALPRTRLSLHRELGELELKRGNLHRGIEELRAVYDGFLELQQRGQVGTQTLSLVSYRLGVAYLRMGETENCSAHGVPQACILPLRGEAIHRKREGSERAVEMFTHVLEIAPEDSRIHRKARWLLNLAYMTLNRHPQAVPPRYLISLSAFGSDEPFPHFSNVAPALGLDTFSMAGSVVVDDFDGDGLLDVLTSSFDPTEPMRMFRNDGAGGFRDVSDEANLSGMLGGFNLMQADYDNDGDLDVLVLRGGWWGDRGRFPNSLLRNDGRGRFYDVTFAAGLGESRYPTQAGSWADYDNDGDLDLYVGNEASSELRAPCELWRNEGDGTFTDVAEGAGVRNERFAKAVSWGDYDADGDPDLYVSNLGAANRLYRNDGDGTFTDVAVELSVEEPRASFPTWFWDFDNDGALDIFVGAYDWFEGGLAAVAASALGEPHESEHARIYRGTGRGGFEEVAASLGLTGITLPMAGNFGDLDNDGWLDFYLGTGYPDYEALMPNVMYRSRNGGSFADVSLAGGFGHLQKGHGIAFADLDHDGDQDVFEQMGGFFVGDKYGDALFENPGFGNRWVAIELEGRQSNRSAIGARIRVDVIEGAERRSVHRTVNSGGSFGANPLRQSVGLGHSGEIERIEIWWPTSRTRQVFDAPPTERLLRIAEGEEDYEVIELESFSFQ